MDIGLGYRGGAVNTARPLLGAPDRALKARRSLLFASALSDVWADGARYLPRTME